MSKLEKGDSKDNSSPNPDDIKKSKALWKVNI